LCRPSVIRSRRNAPKVHDAPAGFLHVFDHPRVRPGQSVWGVRACRSPGGWRLSKQVARRDSWRLFGVCVDEAVNQTRITDMCRVVGRSRVLLQWRWLGIGEGTRDESERHNEAQYTVLLVPCLQKGEVKCEGRPNGWNWVRRKGTLVV
jgi:hypothetical protein